MPTAASLRHHARRRRALAGWISALVVVVSLVLGALLIAGCARSQAIVEAPITPVASDAVPTQPPTSEPTAQPSVTPAPTETAMPRPSATASPTTTPSPTTEPLSAAITVARPRLVQGHTGMVRVAANQACEVTGSLADRTLRFVRVGEGQHVALVGIHALASAETLPLTVDVASEDGQRLSLATTVEIVTGDYGEEVIHLAPEVSKLLDPKIAEPENQLMGAVWATFSPDVLWADRFEWPVVGPFTSYFGTRRSYGGQVSSYHAGIDIDGETGDQVKAAADGVVVLVEPLQVRGNVVVIDHGAGVLTGYFHLDSFAVEKGQTVKAGDVIGSMGATGLVTGSHLHWELHVGEVAANPAEWVEQAPLP